jgi:hypothetical protein
MENASEHAPTLLYLERRIDDCCDRYEAAWKAGQSPQIEAYIDGFPADALPQLLRELLVIEVNYWRRAEDQQLTKEIFLAAHPQLAALIDGDLEQVFNEVAGAKTKRTALLPQGELGAFGKRRSTRRDSRGLHIRCPHCQNPVELLADAPLEEITCGACGDSFSLVERTGQATSAPVLKRIGRFELTSRLGVGGFGTVWKALDTELDRVVALKIPRKGQLSPDETEQFFREARAAAQLKHPNIVPVHEVGRDEDTIFIVTDLIHGVSLASWLQEELPSAREAAALCAQIADALDFAHRQGVVHRDLKPSNVMIDVAGQPHLMDFGLAKREIGEVTMTVDGQILGTPAYMSPEQAQGQNRWVDRRTDIYSLGIVLYEMLTGELPYRGGVQQQIHQRINDDAPSPRKLKTYIPADLDTICLKCLERDPNRRYSTAAELSGELHRFLRGEPIKARPISASARAFRWAQRNPALAAAGVLTVALAVGGPLAAIIVNHSRRTIVWQSDKIQQQLDERNKVIADYERQKNVQASKLQAVSKEREAIVTANPGIERIVPEWRKKVIRDYLKQHEPAIQASVKGGNLGAEARAQTEIGLALMQREVDRADEALSHFQAATTLLSQLVKEHASVDKYRLALADCYMQMSDLQRSRDLKSEAQESVRRAIAIHQDLAKRHPTNSAYKLEHLDAMMAIQGASADSKPLAQQNFAEEAAHLRQTEDVRSDLQRNLSAAPTDLYKLSCYLTLRQPLLTSDEEADESK